MMGGDKVPITPFPGGVNNIDDVRELPEGTLREAVNVDITKSGRMRRRPGYTLVGALVDAHSLHSNGDYTLLVENGSLKRVMALLPTLTLATVHAVSGYLSYADINGAIYYSDGVMLRKYADGEDYPGWTPNPNGPPTVSTGPGGLVPGKYQIAITNIGHNGDESGADLATEITVESGGISLTNIPQTTEAAYVRVYMTSPGGKVLRQQYDVSMGTETLLISSYQKGRPLKTQFANPLTPGHIIEHHYGRLYSAEGSTLHYSMPMRFGLGDLVDNHLRFPDRITMVMSHATGLFVVAGDMTYFMAGSDPEAMVKQEVYPHGAVEYTGAYIDASILGLEQAGVVPCWFTENGLVVGSAGGAVLPLTDKQLSPGEYGEGSTFYREENGIRKLITTLRSKATEGFGATDNVTFTVIRNGVEVD